MKGESMEHRKIRSLLSIAILTALAAIVWIAPVQAAPTQQDNTTPVYALPGILRVASNQPFGTYLVASDGSLYGLSGETPAVEDQIVNYRETIRVRRSRSGAHFTQTDNLRMLPR